MWPLLIFAGVAAVLAAIGAQGAQGMTPAASDPPRPPSPPTPPPPAPSPAPGPAPPPAAAPAAVPMVAMGPTSFPQAPHYKTKLEDVALPGAWAMVNGSPFGILRDRCTGGFAQLDYDDALQVAAKLGVTMATFQEIVAYSDAARAAKTEIQPPITFPTPDMLKAANILPGNYPTRADYLKVVNAFRDANMASKAWACAHDSQVLARLKALGWDESKPAGNAGKWWEAGAPPGRSYLKGWRNANGTWIQDGVELAPDTPDEKKPAGPHNRGHFDYATRSLVRGPAQAVA